MFRPVKVGHEEDTENKETKTDSWRAENRGKPGTPSTITLHAVE